MAAKLIIKRSNSIINRFRVITVLVNGKTYKIGNGKSVTLNIPKGNYSLRASLDWAKSKPISVNLNNDDEVTILVKPYKYADEVLKLSILVNLFILILINLFWGNMLVLGVVMLLGGIPFCYIMYHIVIAPDKYLRLLLE